MESVVASLPAAGSGDAGDTGRALSQFGIGYVLLADPADQALAEPAERGGRAAAADQVVLVRPVAGLRDGGTRPRRHPVRYRGPRPLRAGRREHGLAPGTSGTLVLAEAAGGWSATLDGKPLATLAAPVDGWAQGFTLPAGGGRLVITRNETARNLSLGAEAAALLVVFVLALPGSRSSVPGARRRGRPRAAGARERPAPAEGTRSARRKRRPQPALAGVTAGRGARAQDGDDTEAGYPAAAGAVDDDPFGTHDDPGYDAAHPPSPQLRPARPSPRWASRRTWTTRPRALGRARAADPADPGAQGPARPGARTGRARRGAGRGAARRPARQAVAPLAG